MYKRQVLHTPGHCPEHISFIVNNYVFCGDTIFACGVGNVRFRGDASMLFRTIHHKMKNLPDNLKLLPGHDYLENNLKFLESIIFEDNDFASDIKNFLLDCKSNELSEIKDIGFEKKYNPFFRIDEFSFLDLLPILSRVPILSMLSESRLFHCCRSCIETLRFLDIFHRESPFFTLYRKRLLFPIFDSEALFTTSL